jgi:hypothetical protein
MKLFTFLVLFPLVFLPVKSQDNPTYYFSAPDFYQLTPFSALETLTFKEKGIKKIEKVSPGNFLTRYYLDENGRVKKSETLKIRGEKTTVTSTGEYKYSPSGKLITRKISGTNDIFFDSVSYNQKGQVIFYKSWWKNLTGQKKMKGNYQYNNMKFLETRGNFNVLEEKANENFITHFYLDSNNRILKRKGPNQTDSIAIQTSDQEETLTYWFKNKEIKNFRIGMVRTYSNGLLIKEVRYDRRREHHKKNRTTINTYRPDKKIEASITEYRGTAQTFYNYNNQGLLSEISDKKGNRVTGVTRFTYFTQ